MAVSLSDLVTQEAKRLECQDNEELWTCIRIIHSHKDNSVGVAFMGIFSSSEAAQKRAVANNKGPIEWQEYEKAGRYQGSPRGLGKDQTIFYVIQRDKRL